MAIGSKQKQKNFPSYFESERKIGEKKKKKKKSSSATYENMKQWNSMHKHGTAYIVNILFLLNGFVY